MTASAADDLRRCVESLRTAGWEAAAPAFARLVSRVPAAPDARLAGSLGRLLAARERLDAVEAADLLEGELAPLFGATPRLPDAEAGEDRRVDGRRLFSQLVPRREASLQRRHVEGLAREGGLLLVGAEGSPLVEALARRTATAPLFLAEFDPARAARARELAGSSPRAIVVLEPDDPTPAPSGPFGAWIHPALPAAEREEAWRWIARLRVRTAAPPRPVPGRTRRVVLVDRGRPFHGEADLCDSLAGAGWHVQVRSATGGAEDERLVDALLASPPDFVLSVNGAALVLSPLLRESLDAASIPTVLWFVDDPEVALRRPERFARPHVLALAWERAAVAQLRGWGFEGAAYLPHATRRARDDASTPLEVEGDLVWAASSYAGEDRLRLAQAAAGAQPWIEAFTERLAAFPQLSAATIRRAMLALPEAAPLRDDAERALFVQVAAADRATALRRVELARALLPEGLQLFGDAEGWRSRLGADAPVRPDLHPLNELPRLYAPGRICLDLAHAQMPTALTQRAFDVTGAGAVLLADDRPDLREHFEVGVEALAFQDPSQAREMVRWCRRNPDRARTLAERGFLRTRREHRWSRRVRQLLDRVRERFGS